MKTKKRTTDIFRPVILMCLFLGILGACGDSDRNADEDMNLERQENANQERLKEGQNQNNNQGQVFETTLSGENEVPAVTTSASGNATIILQADSIHIEGEFTGLSSDYTASHIHKGAEGENGKPIITLEPAVSNNSTNGTWDEAYKITEAQIKALKADSLYINVHSADHKSGEVRGQLSSSGMNKN